MRIDHCCLFVAVATAAVSQGQEIASERQILDAIAAQQSSLAEVYARFDLRVSGPLAESPGHVLSEPVHGSMIWALSGTRERLSVRFDKPASVQPGILEDRDVFRAGDVSTVHFRRYGSVVISEESSLPFIPTPGDILGFGVRRTLAELATAGATVTTNAGADGNYSLNCVCPWLGPKGITIDASVRADADFAVASWNWQENARTSRIEWEWDDAQAAVVPRLAEWTTRTGERWTLIAREFRYGTPPAHELEFRFEPGMLVTDHYNKQQNGKPTVFRINASGNRESVELVPFRPAAEQPGGATPATAAIAVGGLVVLSAWLRLRFK